MFETTSRSRNRVGPRISTVISSSAASAMFMLDSSLMPLSTPLAADRVARPVTTTMMMTCTGVEFGSTPRWSRPAAIWFTPKPREVAMPNRVPTSAMMSMRSPIQVSVRLPRIGSSAQRIETGRPLRCTA